MLQVDEQIGEKLFGQLVRLPQTSLLVDVKELGYDNGAVAVMDLVRQYQVGFHSPVFEYTQSPTQEQHWQPIHDPFKLTSPAQHALRRISETSKDHFMDEGYK